ncbi:MAG: hypothetical protein ACPL7D_07990 [Candidatus Sumerlaeaceae bacterium]
MRRILVLLAVTILTLVFTPMPARAGWLSNFLGKDQTQQEQAAAAEKGPNAKRAGGDKLTSATPTPDPAQVKKLKAALDWEKPPKDLFQRYAGTWQGDFWVYSVEGRLEQHNKMRITYTPQADGSMKMEMWSGDLISKLWVTKVTAIYTVEGEKIFCTVQQPDGSTFKQIGHYNDGSVFFLSQINDGIEHSRERIDGKRLLTDGFGVYGSLKKKDAHVFIGRFLKQD